MEIHSLGNEPSTRVLKRQKNPTSSGLANEFRARFRLRVNNAGGERIVMPSRPLIISNGRELIGESNLIGEAFGPSEITEGHIKEIADYFRLIFNNDWGEFAFCPPCDSKSPKGMKFSASEVFKQEGPIPLEIMDQGCAMPKCPHCDETTELFHDPERTYELIKEKLYNGNGYLSLLRDVETSKVKGFCYGYACTLLEQFKGEFGNKYNYSAKKDPKYDRFFSIFIDCLKRAFPEEDFNADKRVFCWNCIAISKKMRGSGQSRTLIDNFINSIPPDKFKLYNIGQVIRGSKWHEIIKRSGAKDIPGFLEGDEILTGVIFKKSVDFFRTM